MFLFKEIGSTISQFTIQEEKIFRMNEYVCHIDQLSFKIADENEDEKLEICTSHLLFSTLGPYP